jgi:CHAT domain-containing protein
MPVSNPLTFARVEAETIAPFFAADARRLFLDQEATHPQVSGTLTEGVNGGHTYVHFSCHGVFDPNEPLASGLLLAGEERLTLADLLDRLALNCTRLVVLSACQTAITDFNRLPDEAIGLPAGFLTAGVPGVVGSLWPVNDVSTALLMTHFYHCHRQEGLEPIAALRKAQKWMRCDLTLDQVVDYINHYLSQLDQNLDRSDRMPPIDPVWYLELEGTRDELVKQHHENMKALPFASPYYWAAFTMSGV